MLNGKNGKSHKICVWLLAGMFCVGTLGFCAAPAYAATSYQYRSIREQHDWNTEAQYERKAAEKRTEQERRMRESAYDHEE